MDHDAPPAKQHPKPADCIAAELGMLRREVLLLAAPVEQGPDA
jgi:hypothetical protein